jgi:predicted TPR repeat methyltransferase
MKTFDVRTGYDLYAPNYRKDHAHLDSFDWENARQALMAQLEGGLERAKQPLRFLDLGCGDGRILKRLVRTVEQRQWTGRVELHGWDISDGMLKQAAKAAGPSVHLARRDLMDLVEAAPDGPRFDLVASFFVLVHIEQPGDFCQALAGLLSPGGRAVFNNIPQRDALVLEAQGRRFQIEYCHHENGQVLEAIASSGLSLVDTRDTDWSTLFIVVAPD